jgi:uncharacterized protein (DUF3820 family)
MNHDPLQWLVTRVMPYSKYKGRLIADLPGEYLNWFARKGFPPGEIGLLLALLLCKDRGNWSVRIILPDPFMLNVQHRTRAASPPR